MRIGDDFLKRREKMKIFAWSLVVIVILVDSFGVAVLPFLMPVIIAFGGISLCIWMVLNVHENTKDDNNPEGW